MDTRFFRMDTRFPRLLAFGVATMLVCGGSAHAYENANVALATKSTSVALNRLLVSDMSQPSEKLPQGVPTWYDWATHPRVHPVATPSRFHAFTAWGQLYQCAGTSGARGDSVQLRNLQAWVLPKDSTTWQNVQATSELQGAAFAEDYVGASVPAHYVAKDSGTAVTPVARHNFHFWPSSGRVSLRPAQVLGVIVAVQARLRTRAARSAPPCMVLSVGGDLWRSLRVQPGGDNSADVGIGRFKRVESRWRVFTMTTASDAVLDRAPLPYIAPADEDF